MSLVFCFFVVWKYVFCVFLWVYEIKVVIFLDQFDWFIDDVFFFFILVYFDIICQWEVFVQWIIFEIIICQQMVQVWVVGEGDVIYVEGFMFELVGNWEQVVD